MPEHIRPRERLLNDGAEALGSGELLAILIRTGNKRETAIDIANKILFHCKGLRGLASISVEDLSSFSGIGDAKIAQIKAAVELGGRIFKENPACRSQVKSPLDVVDLLMEMQFLDREHFRVIYLNTKNYVIAIEKISIGSLSSSIVHPREVFKKAIEKSAAAIILAHNHPSGDPEPSKEDIKVTQRVAEAGKILGIDVLDHIIIGDGKFKSLKEMNLI